MKENWKTDVYMDPKPWDPLPFNHAEGECEKWDNRFHSPICFHPNKKGYTLMVDNMMDKIKELHPHLIRKKGFNNKPEIIWDGGWEGFPHLIEDRIEFDHEGMTDDDYEYFQQHGKLPWQ